MHMRELVDNIVLLGIVEREGSFDSVNVLFSSISRRENTQPLIEGYSSSGQT